MPDQPEPRPAATQATVTALHEVTAQLASLDAKLGQAERQTRRWLASLAVAVAVAIGGSTVANNAAISWCFLSQPKPGSVERSICGRLFFGYGPAMRQADQNRARFAELLSQIPDNRARLDQLEHEVEQLRE